MEMDEIESIYEQKIQEANNLFIKGLVQKQKKEKIEREYKSRLDSARNDYYTKIKKYLSEHKYKKEEKKKKKEEKKKKTDYNYHKTLKDNIMFKLKMSKFFIKIKTRQFRDLFIINRAIFKLKKSKIIFRHKFNDLENSISHSYTRNKEYIIKKLIKIQESSKENIKKVKDNFNHIKEYIKSKIFKKKEEKASV